MKITDLGLALFFVILSGCASPQRAPAPVAELPPPPQPLTSPGTKFALLPSAVQRTVIAYGGAEEIKDINKVSMDQDIYEIQFKDPSPNPALYVAADGTPMNNLMPASQPTAFNVILPPPVQWSLEQEAPCAVVTDIEPSELTLYQISLAGTNAHPKLSILEDGTVLKGQ